MPSAGAQASRDTTWIEPSCTRTTSLNGPLPASAIGRITRRGPGPPGGRGAAPSPRGGARGPPARGGGPREHRGGPHSRPPLPGGVGVGPPGPPPAPHLAPAPTGEFGPPL